LFCRLYIDMGQSVSSPEADTNVSFESHTEERDPTTSTCSPSNTRGKSTDTNRTDDRKMQPQSFSNRRPSTVSLSNYPPITLATPQEWKETLGHLTDHELQEVILSAPLSETDIKTMAARIRQHHHQQQHTSRNEEERVTYQDHNQINDQPSTSETNFYVTTSVSQKQLPFSTTNTKTSNGNHHNEDDELTALCFRMLRISPTMAKLRFRLVPTKLKEHMFWQALWTILHETILQERQQKQQQDQPNDDIVKKTDQGQSSTMGVGDFQAQTSTRTSNSESRANKDPPASRTFISNPIFSILHSTHSSAPSATTVADSIDMEFADFQKKQVEETIFKLRRTIERQEWKIQEMQREMDRLCKEQQSPPHDVPLRNSSPTESSSSSSTGGSVKDGTTLHIGQWVMDQDSKDFLEFPDELKDNLRMEKQKRLEEVEQQMKFILNSDDIQDSNGHWDCCGQAKYNSTCSKNGTKQ
jgi:hypothetical protein